MKKKLYLILLPAVLFISCGKHFLSPCCNAYQPLLVTAEKNDTSWSGAAFEGAGGYQPMKISAASISSLNKNNVNDTLLVTINYNNSQSTYKLHSGDVTYRSAVAGGPVKSYQLDTLNANNTVTVSQYNMNGNFVEGTFTLNFINPGKPDISFLGGKFQEYINE